MKKIISVVTVAIVFRLIFEPLIGLLLPIILDARETVDILNNELFWVLYPYFFNILFGIYPIILVGKKLKSDFGTTIFLLISLVSILDLPIGLLLMIIFLFNSRQIKDI